MENKNIYEYLTTLSLEALAEHIDNVAQGNENPWDIWFSNTYCKNCPSIEKKEYFMGYPTFQSYAYCELNHKCKFFLDKDDVLSDREIIELWLRSSKENE